VTTPPRPRIAHAVPSGGSPRSVTKGTVTPARDLTYGAGVTWKAHGLGRAKLAHKILHIIIHGKADRLAGIVEFLFNLVLDIDAVAITR
jgi:hypothetical protein